MYYPYYVPSSGPSLNLFGEYKVPYPQYQTSSWYTTPIYDIDRIPSSYTYSESEEIEISRSRLGLNHVYSPIFDSVAPCQERGWSK